MKIWLLTHQRETLKKTNTGQLVQQALAHACETLIWQRKNPDPRLLALLEDNNIALLYPNSGKEDDHENLDHDDQIESAQSTCEHFVIIDSTWQQANKMVNQSPYLQAMPKIALTLQQPSAYCLRRNQKPEGLCTAEVAIALLIENKKNEQAAALENRFQAFNQR